MEGLICPDGLVKAFGNGPKSPNTSSRELLCANVLWSEREQQTQPELGMNQIHFSVQLEKGFGIAGNTQPAAGAAIHCQFNFRNSPCVPKAS